MEITRTSLRAQRDQQIPRQVAQGQTQQKGGYGEELKQQLQTIGDVKREAPVIQAKRVDPIVSETQQYTKDAVKTAMEKLKKFIMGQGLGGDKPGDPEKTASTVSTGGGGGKKDFFTGLTNDQLGLLSTDQLVARDNRMYGNTFPEGSFGSGSLKTIQDSPGSAVDTNIGRHVPGTSEDQPPTVLFQKEKPKGGQGGLPLGTTTLRDGEKQEGPAINASSFLQKNVRGSTSFGGTGKDESQRPKQTVAALPSNYKATEKAAFDKAKSWQDSKAKGQAATKATGIPSGSNLKSGSFGISAEGKKQAEANKAEKNKATPAQKTAIKKSTTVKKSSPSTSKGRGQGPSSKKSGPSSKKSGSTSKSTGSKKASRGAKGGGSSKGGTGKGGTKTSRKASKASKSRTGRSKTRCDIRCKFDISILTNQNLIRDDLADVAYFVKDLQELN